jgi:CRP/FNR family transcriptional regulator
MPVSVTELRSLPLFADASPELVSALATRGTEIRFAASEVVFLTGSKARGWFIVLDGEIRVVRGSRGRQHVVHTEGVGGTLAEVPLVEGGTHPATAIATTATRCALFTRDALESAIAEQPRIAFLLARRLAARVRGLVDRLDERSAHSVDARLVDFLVTLPQPKRASSISLGMTQQALAEELGTVREVVARTLRRLCQTGLLERVGVGRYRIPNRAALVASVRE